jgi:hypothetical protein
LALKTYNAPRPNGFPCLMVHDANICIYVFYWLWRVETLLALRTIYVFNSIYLQICEK